MNVTLVDDCVALSALAARGLPRKAGGGRLSEASVPQHTHTHTAEEHRLVALSLAHDRAAGDGGRAGTGRRSGAAGAIELGMDVLGKGLSRRPGRTLTDGLTD